MCKCNVGPGKFEGESAITYLAYEQSMIGGADASTGIEDRTVDWFRAPFNFDADQGIVETARAYGYCEACISEALADDSAGLAFWQDSQGFAYSNTFPTRKAFDAALAEAEADESEDDSLTA